MSGTERSTVGMKKQRGLGDACGQEPRIKMFHASHLRVLEYVRRAPDIRRDKVREMRRKIASGSRNPASRRVAEKILYEHLFDSALLCVASLSRTSP